MKRRFVNRLGVLLLAFPCGADLPDAPPSRAFRRRPALSSYVNYGEEEGPV